MRELGGSPCVGAYVVSQSSLAVFPPELEPVVEPPPGLIHPSEEVFDALKPMGIVPATAPQ
jgi:hypothetical protein